MMDLCDDVARLEQGEILRIEPSEDALDRGLPMERRCQVPKHHSVSAPLPRREAGWEDEAPILPKVIHAKEVRRLADWRAAQGYNHDGRPVWALEDHVREIYPDLKAEFNHVANQTWRYEGSSRDRTGLTDQEISYYIEQLAFRRRKLRESVVKRYPKILADPPPSEDSEEEPRTSSRYFVDTQTDEKPWLSEDIVSMLKERGPSPGLTAYRKFRYAEEGLKYTYDETGHKAPALLYGPHAEAMEVAETENVGTQGWLKSIINKLKVDFGRWKND